MQDRFKFRVWDKTRKQMRSIWGLTPFGAIVADIKTENHRLSFDDCEIIQCTGLKDKNGNLIYEGDIIKGSCGVYWGNMIVKFNENKAMFYLERIDKKYKELSFHGKNKEDNFDIEIIGNIYENPELLN